VSGKVVILDDLQQYRGVKCEVPADWPGLFVFYCFNYTPWSITTMPLAEKIFLFCFLLIEAILED
jgi:hypothetical protein